MSSNIDTNTMRSLVEAANGINEASGIPTANFTPDQYELYGPSARAAADRLNAILNAAVRKYYTRFPKVDEHEYRWGGNWSGKLDWESPHFKKVTGLMREAGSEVQKKMGADDVIRKAGGGDSEPYRVVRRYMESAATAALGFDPRYSYF
jgi:hypothetical protein